MTITMGHAMRARFEWFLDTGEIEIPRTGGIYVMDQERDLMIAVINSNVHIFSGAQVDRATRHFTARSLRSRIQELQEAAP